MSFTVVLVGRPNVGKSTLFNRLTGRRAALVDDLPGVTRDRREGQGRIGDLFFTVIDTAGLEEAFDDSLEARMRRQTEAAVLGADVCLLVVDARAGITPLDEHFARWLRKGRTPVHVIANKCEGQAGQPGLLEAFGLGLGDPVPLSAAHGEGLADLMEILLPYERVAPAPALLLSGAGDTMGDTLRDGGPDNALLIDPADEGWEGALDSLQILEDDETDGSDGTGAAVDEAAEAAAMAAAAAAAAKPVQLSIVGRPNVGKSTLVNALLGEDRMLTGPEAGITRDAIAIPFTWAGRQIRLVDTAGMRRKTRIEARLEKLAVQDSLNAIRYAHVVVLVVDPDELLERQDLAIARLVEQEGRALIIAINKWDTVTDAPAVLQRLKDRLQTSLPQLKGLSTVVISGRTGHNLPKLMDAALSAYATWNRRVRTKDLNRWLAAMVDQHPPPLVQGRRLKLRFMTQARIRPPRFALWTSRPDALPEDYRRYLVNGLRDAFDLPGVPIRLSVRRTKNPFEG